MSFLPRLSRFVVRIELFMAAVFVLAAFGLILTNVVMRTAGQPIFWINEVAVLAMVWMAFLGASVAIHYRSSVAVTLLADAAGPTVRLWLGRLVDTLVLGFCLFLLWTCWIWFDPIAMYEAGFNLRAFRRATFNFLYEERLVTVDMQKFWFWFIIPLFAFTASIHALSNLVTGWSGQRAAVQAPTTTD